MELNEVTATARDAAYVMVGFGVIGFQRAQVRRREVAKQLAEARDQLTSVAKDIEQQLRSRVTV